MLKTRRWGSNPRRPDAATSLTRPCGGWLIPLAHFGSCIRAGKRFAAALTGCRSCICRDGSGVKLAAMGDAASSWRSAVNPLRSADFISTGE